MTSGHFDFSRLQLAPLSTQVTDQNLQHVKNECFSGHATIETIREVEIVAVSCQGGPSVGGIDLRWQRGAVAVAEPFDKATPGTTCIQCYHH